jgi:hypothetical protein
MNCGFNDGEVISRKGYGRYTTRKPDQNIIINTNTELDINTPMLVEGVGASSLQNYFKQKLKVITFTTPPELSMLSASLRNGLNPKKSKGVGEYVRLFLQEYPFQNEHLKENIPNDALYILDPDKDQYFEENIWKI